jgi:hypothetical protein
MRACGAANQQPRRPAQQHTAPPTCLQAEQRVRGVSRAVTQVSHALGQRSALNPAHCCRCRRQLGGGRGGSSAQHLAAHLLCVCVCVRVCVRVCVW